MGSRLAATTAGLAVLLAGCTGHHSPDRRAAGPAEAGPAPGAPTTVPPQAPSDPTTSTTEYHSTTSTTWRPPTSSSTTRPSQPAPTLQVSRIARAGEVPPGQTQPLEADAWRVAGSRWGPGEVAVIVKRPGGEGVVVDLGPLLTAQGRWFQTFVLRNDLPRGRYVVVASQGRRHAEASLLLS